MRTRFLIYIGASLTLVLLGCIGYVLLNRYTFPSATRPLAPAVSATSTVPQPPNTKRYTSPTYRFSLYYPDTLTVTEHPGAEQTMTVLFEGQTGRGFQIFIAPDSDSQITEQRFLLDEPSGVMQNRQNITIDGSPATEFESTNQAMGASEEVWFLHQNYLYEVTAPQPLASWLISILETWSFS